jgi:hypothetical protein
VFKVNPKQMALSKAQFLIGRDKKIKVDGHRLTPVEAKAQGFGHGIAGTYVAECFVDDQLIASANDHDWRVAYKKLKIVIEKQFEKKK